MRSPSSAFPLECFASCLRAFCGGPAPSSPAMRALLLRRRRSSRRAWELHSRFSRLGEADGNRLLWVAYPMLPFSHVVNFFPNEFSGLGTRGFALAGILTGAFQGLFLRHKIGRASCR